MAFTLNKRYNISLNASNAFVPGYINFKDVYRVVASGTTFYPSGNILKMVYNAVGNYFFFRDGNDDTLFAFDNTDYHDCQFYGTPYSYTSQSNVESMVANGYLSYTSVDEYFILYQLACEKHVVNKANYITFYNEINGSFKEQIDIANPSILIQYASVPQCNYVYIPSLNRYYFINKITCVRKSLYQLDLHVDVLYSFNTDIRSQKAFVTRNENANPLSYVIDNRIPLYDIPIVTYYTNTASGSLVNTTFDPSYDDETESYDFRYMVYTAIVTNANASEPTEDMLIEPDISGLPNISGTYLRNPSFRTYAIYRGEWGVVCNTILTNDTLASFVVNVIALPFEITRDIETINKVIYIGDEKLGSETVNYSAPLIKSEISSPIIIADFTYSNTYSNYLKVLPYMWDYELFIPYYGWLKVDSVDVVGKRIIVYYTINYVTGDANVFVYNNTNSKLIFTSSCQLGVKFALNNTNATELNNQRNANTSNLVLGLIGSAVSTGVGIGTQNPLAIVGGVLTAGKTIASYVNTNAMLLKHAQTVLGSSNASLYTGQQVILKIYQRPTTTVDADVYAHTQGHPINYYGSISGFTGYTEIGEIHYSPSTQLYITKNEIDEIESIVKDGIIL